MFTANAQTKLLTLALMVSGAVNVTLARVVLKRSSRPASPPVQIGTVMPPLRVLDSAKNSASIPYDDISIPTVVYVFSPHCGFCRKNAKNIASLANQVSGRFRVIGVSLQTDGIDKFVEETGITFPVYTDMDPGVKQAFRAAGTPETYVIGPDNRLRRIWKGAYASPTKQSVEEFFGVQLPGLPT
jgi:peroxiredoxin